MSTRATLSVVALAAATAITAAALAPTGAAATERAQAGKPADLAISGAFFDTSDPDVQRTPDPQATPDGSAATVG